ncbi:MAG: hypothetical protein MUP70_06285 [Candidatus Aminicenantes bacterium]|nr:hypothetical protein [Candidatus Aminicenantes bacterium]
MRDNYSFKEIKNKFEYISQHLSEGEINFLFITLSHYLARNIIDDLVDNVSFICFTSSKIIGGRYAYYENKKEGYVIVYTHFAFKSYNKQRDHHNCVNTILHEVAHFVLRHGICKDDNEKVEKEKEAKDLALKWITESSPYSEEEKQMLFGSNDVQ